MLAFLAGGAVENLPDSRFEAAVVPTDSVECRLAAATIGDDGHDSDGEDGGAAAAELAPTGEECLE